MKSPHLSNRRRWIAYGCALALLLALGCSKKPAGKRYELEGRVVAVDTAGRTLTVAHGDVSGLMPAMTMPFLVARNDEWIFDKIAPGDHIHATLVMTKRAELTDITFTKSNPPEGDGTSRVRIPETGDVVPDFTFLNQSGKTVRLEQFRGKPLLLTFIYTRCPIPEYCPLISSHFGEVLRLLQNDRAAFEKAQLVSISIDPERDTPAVLQSYGAGYVKAIDPTFQHWQFVTGAPEEVRKAADFFGISYDKSSGQIVHNLRTALIAADGRIIKVYPGNQWKAADAANDFAAAADAR
jgi:protein SCO1/2